MGKTSIGLQDNVASMLCYCPFIGWVVALILFITEKEDKTVRFNALQALFLCMALLILAIVLSFIPVIGWILLPLLNLGVLVLLIVLMVKTNKGEKVLLPVIGEMAEKNA